MNPNLMVVANNGCPLVCDDGGGGGAGVAVFVHDDYDLDDFDHDGALVHHARALQRVDIDSTAHGHGVIAGQVGNGVHVRLHEHVYLSASSLMRQRSRAWECTYWKLLLLPQKCQPTANSHRAWGVGRHAWKEALLFCDQ